jgi:hypothetical protein
MNLLYSVRQQRIAYHVSAYLRTLTPHGMAEALGLHRKYTLLGTMLPLSERASLGQIRGASASLLKVHIPSGYVAKINIP